MSDLSLSGRIQRGLILRRPSWRQRRELAGLLFTTPALAMGFVFFLVPLAFAIWISMTDWGLMGYQSFVGLDNYLAIAKDATFLRAIGFSTFFGLTSTAIIFAVGLVLALMLQAPRRRNTFLRTMFYLPVVVGTSAIIFLWAFDFQVGPVNGALRALGLIDRGIAWLADPTAALIALFVLTTWRSAGLAMILLLIGLLAVPRDVLEAAAVDGASKGQQLRHITLPLIRPFIILVLIITFLAGFLAFDQFYILTKGGPDNSTISVVYWIVREALRGFRFGYATALSVVLMVGLVFFTAIQLRLLRRNPLGE